jgi:hypothetical protein
LFEATSCGRYFSDYGSERAKVWKITNFTIVMLNSFFTIGFRAKNSIDRNRKSYPRNFKMCSYLTFDLNLKVMMLITHIGNFIHNIWPWPAFQGQIWAKILKKWYKQLILTYKNFMCLILAEILFYFCVNV